LLAMYGVIRGALQRSFLSVAVLFAGMGSGDLRAAQDDVVIGDFGATGLTGWTEKSFSGKTDYRIVETDVGKVVKATSDNSASGLFREITVDLEKTPCLTWSWKVDNVLGGLDETAKSGDDYAARVYVIFSGGLFFWNTRTFSYVWSGGRPVGAAWPNPYTANATVVAAQSGRGKVGRWVVQSRNVADDYRRFVGGDIKQADGIAIMTDTDGSGRSATAWYGDIRFTASCG